MVFTIEKLQEIEEHLETHPTLEEGGVPGPADAYIFNALGSNSSPIQKYQKKLNTQTSTIGTSSPITSGHPNSKLGLINMLVQLQQLLLLLLLLQLMMISILLLMMNLLPRNSLNLKPRINQKQRKPNQLQNRL